jgi:hypothetical protein
MVRRHGAGTGQPDRPASESVQYLNIAVVHRQRSLAQFHKYGAGAVFAGHCHQRAEAADGPMAMITTGPEVR